MSSVTIAIPPFPSQDLAKLVLGYLAEEQLMTAYDEFLQASPYLDALRNEYDRIFMTSLKNILAEYRAVKIYVETCKPLILRRKLFQCPNLLEIVKFLVSNLDLNKLLTQEGNEKAGQSKHSVSKSNVCEVCISLKLKSCVCGSSQSASQIEASSLEPSVETTSLADLPGNSLYKKRVTKPVESNNFNTISSSGQIQDGCFARPTKCSDNLSSTNPPFGGIELPDTAISSVTEKNSTVSPTLLVKDYPALEKRVPGLNDDFNIVNHNKNESMCLKDYKDFSTTKGKTTDTFAGGVDSSSTNKVIVPDSSTSENSILQASTTEIENNTSFVNVNKNIARNQVLIKVGHEKKNLMLQSNNVLNLPRLATKESLVKSGNRKAEDQSSPKITILSDVKVDNDLKMPSILKNATSTPLIQMQTLLINGTPAYKQAPVDKKFTEDEIMAMPTIILVPSSDKTKKTVPIVTQGNMLNSSTTAVTYSSRPPLGPLVIDVSTSDTTSSQISNPITDNPLLTMGELPNDNRLIKTVEITSHASLPKDNTFTDLKTSTPQVLPPTRKSSSTPRRTSHIRVLDFTTPRRILHETINEQDVNQCSSTDVAVSEEASSNVINKTNNVETIPKTTGIPENVNSSGDTSNGATKENKATIKLYNWDSKLRALAYVGNGNIEKSQPTRKPKTKKSKKKESPSRKSTCHDKSEEAKTVKSKETKKGAYKVKSSKHKQNSIDLTEAVANPSLEKVTVSILKPTINIICRNKYPESTESDKCQNKSTNSDEHINTPELEKMSLQNEIGAKLNISDLLETPYKQALYDIQMETPKFLGPDIPGDPLSDIKIMNIPTPRFLNTPKLPQNTPSSYSSRPTDYSSGGSYYKPDDQEYVLANEIIEDALSLSAEPLKKNNESNANGVAKVNETVDKVCEGKSRPVRQCTKNVSYNYASPSVSSKIKDLEDKVDKTSTCSDICFNKTDKNSNKPKVIKSDKDSKTEKKRESKKKNKKYKSPAKREVPKTFMKIKPRRTTPVKEILGKGRKKAIDHSQIVYIKPQSRKLVASKERNVNFLSIDFAPLPTKSRRKSTTPRKLLCTKKFNSESSEINSPEQTKPISILNETEVTGSSINCYQNSDSEQLPLRWSDDSQESQIKKIEEKALLASEGDDITRIKEYINTTVAHKVRHTNEGEVTLQVDLIKRGFDIETARKIERDLLEPSSQNVPIQISLPNIVQSGLSPVSLESKKNESESKKSDRSADSDSSNNLQIVQDDDDELDLSVHECNEDTSNFFVYKYDDATFTPSDQIKLKETYSMEICIDDVAVRLRAMPFNTVFEHDVRYENLKIDDKKCVEKYENPCRNDMLYTPRKAQCYEIFDSTLASLDTPLKSNSPLAQEPETVAEIVLEVEKLETDTKPKPDTKKRKRLQSGPTDECLNASKRVKPDTPYLLNSASIQNIDIESVLSKLHGP